MLKNKTPTKDQTDAVLLADPAIVDGQPQSGDQAEPIADSAAATQATPRLGDLIQVRVAEGMALVNNETGLDFEQDQDTYQTVTVTTLRRLADGDLVQV